MSYSSLHKGEKLLNFYQQQQQKTASSYLSNTILIKYLLLQTSSVQIHREEDDSVLTVSLGLDMYIASFLYSFRLETTNIINTVNIITIHAAMAQSQIYGWFSQYLPHKHIHSDGIWSFGQSNRAKKECLKQYNSMDLHLAVNYKDSGANR